MNSRDLYNLLRMITDMFPLTVAARSNFSVSFSSQENRDKFKELLDQEVFIKKHGEYYVLGFKGLWLLYLYERPGGLK